MATPTPFSFNGTLNFPEAPSLAPDPIPFGMSAQFSQKADFVYSFTGTGTQVINFGTLTSPGLKGLLVALDAAAGVSPIIVKVNSSSTGGIEISSGGFMAVGSPAPASGVTALSIDYSSTCTVRAWILG